MAPSLSLLLLLACSLNVAESRIRIFGLRASNLPADLLGITDGYVKVSCASTNLGKTKVRHDTVNPWWEEEFSMSDAKENDMLRLEVRDHDLIFDDLLGVCEHQIKPGTHQRDCYLKSEGTLHYSYSLSQ